MKNDAKALQAHSQRAEFSGNTTNFHEEVQGQAQIKHKNRSKAQTKIYAGLVVVCALVIAGVVWVLQTAFGFLNQDLVTEDRTTDMLTSKEEYSRGAAPVKESTQYIISHIEKKDTSQGSQGSAYDFTRPEGNEGSIGESGESTPTPDKEEAGNSAAPIIDGIPTGHGNGNSGNTQTVSVVPGRVTNNVTVVADKDEQEPTPAAVGQEGHLGPNQGEAAAVQPNIMQFGNNSAAQPGTTFSGGNAGSSGFSDSGYSQGGNGEKPLTLAQRQRQSPMMGAKLGDTPANDYGEDGEPRKGKADDLTKNLTPVQLDEGSATRLRNRSYLLPQGTFITCILETAVNTTVPGLTTCRIPKDVYSLDGKTLLIERGSRALGEYKGAIAQGQARVFVLWTKIETPHGVMIQLDSPGADTLGRSGLAGGVDYHWWERFGNALLFSLIDDGFRVGMSSMQEGDNNTYTTTDSSIGGLLQEVMITSGQIPPTILINQGARIGIMTARSVDMSNVYTLKKDAD